jgi:uncharacterized coiled-coil protein SlyX
MDTKYFDEQFSLLKNHIDARIDGIEKRMDSLEKRIDSIEKIIQKMGIEIEAIRADVRLIAEGHVMLNEKFTRFESEYIRHAAEMRHDVLNLYRITYGELERRVKALETVK